MARYVSSHKGNPYHDWHGRFCKKGECRTVSSRPQDYYDAKEEYRRGDISEADFQEKVKDLPYDRAEFMSEEQAKKVYDARERTKAFTKGLPEKFTPAKTVQEAKSFLEGLGVRAEFSGMDVEACNMLNESIFDTFKAFPKTAEFVKVAGNAQVINRAFKADLQKVFALEMAMKTNGPVSVNYIKRMSDRAVGRVGSNSIAFVRTPKEYPDPHINEVLQKYRGVYINEKRCSHYSLDEAMKFSENFHPVHTGKSALDHEMGHIIDQAYGLSAGRITQEYGGRFKLFDVWKGNGTVGEWSPKEVEDGLSIYGRSDTQEFIAECWSEYRNSEQPREIAKTVGEYIERYAGDVDAGR